MSRLRSTAATTLAVAATTSAIPSTGSGGASSVPTEEVVAGPCEVADEETVFKARCVTQMASWEVRRKWPVLVIYVHHPEAGGASILGTGQVLSIAMRLHAMCLKLQRWCYLKLYYTKLEKYFGFADGTSWDPARVTEVHPEAKNESIWTRRMLNPKIHVTLKHTRYIESPLYKQLVNETAPYVHLSLFAIFFTRPSLEQGSTVGMMKRENMAGSMLANVSAVKEQIFDADPCWLRFVTQPLNRTRTQSLPRSPLVVHMRTGFADTHSRLLSVVRRNSSAAATWMEAACGRGSFAKGPVPVALSDSPGILHWFGHRHGARLGASSTASNSVGTRTWGAKRFVHKPDFHGAEFGAYDDIVTAGFATTLHTLAQSVASSTNGSMLRPTSFTWPAIGRSMCIVKADLSSPECPRFGDVFLRDFATAAVSNFVDRPAHNCTARRQPQCNGVGRWSNVYDMSTLQNASHPTHEATQASWTRIRSNLIEEHPCKRLPNVAECVLWQIEAEQ